MSTDEDAEDAHDPEHVRVILMRAEDTFDGQECVMLQAAYDLQCRAIAHSGSCGHCGII
jgi:hypothetical protein